MLQPACQPSSAEKKFSRFFIKDQRRVSRSTKQSDTEFRGSKQTQDNVKKMLMTDKGLKFYYNVEAKSAKSGRKKVI
jgi:hypothetical protein